MKLNSEWIDLLKDLKREKVRFLVVGGHAVGLHGQPRFTGDLDLWVDATEENAARVWRALKKYGAPLARMSPKDFANPSMVYQIGVEPNRIDIMMGIEAVSFDKAWRARVKALLGEVPVFFIGRLDFIRNKQAAGRTKDLDDVATVIRQSKRRSRRKK